MAREKSGEQGKPRANKPPVKSIRVGRIQASVWENDGPEGIWYSVTLARHYQDAQKNWKSSSSLGRDDLLVAAELLRACFQWIYGKQGVDFGNPEVPYESDPAPEQPEG